MCAAASASLCARSTAAGSTAAPLVAIAAAVGAARRRAAVERRAASAGAAAAARGPAAPAAACTARAKPRDPAELQQTPSMRTFIVAAATSGLADQPTEITQAAGRLGRAAALLRTQVMQASRGDYRMKCGGRGEAAAFAWRRAQRRAQRRAVRQRALLCSALLRPQLLPCLKPLGPDPPPCCGC